MARLEGEEGHQVRGGGAEVVSREYRDHEKEKKKYKEGG